MACKDMEYCIDHETPAKYHCRKCGVPICRKCFNHQDGMCYSCKEADEIDMDDEDTYEFARDVTV